MNKTLLALVLGLIPGLGHLYLKSLDGLFYIVEALYYYFPLQFLRSRINRARIAFSILLAVLWVVNLLDLVITIVNQSKNKQPEN